jgi:hypothetical protein
MWTLFDAGRRTEEVSLERRGFHAPTRSSSTLRQPGPCWEALLDGDRLRRALGSLTPCGPVLSVSLGRGDGGLVGGHDFSEAPESPLNLPRSMSATWLSHDADDERSLAVICVVVGRARGSLLRADLVALVPVGSKEPSCLARACPRREGRGSVGCPARRAIRCTPGSWT